MSAAAAPVDTRIAALAVDGPRTGHRRFGGFVDELSPEVFPGEVLALPGESGSGKSLTALSLMRLLVCDEPASALDASPRVRVISLLANFKRRFDLTLLIISHDLRMVGYVSDRVTVMCPGKIVEIGPRESVFGRPAHPGGAREEVPLRQVGEAHRSACFCCEAVQAGCRAAPNHG